MRIGDGMTAFDHLQDARRYIGIKAYPEAIKSLQLAIRKVDTGATEKHMRPDLVRMLRECEAKA